MKIEQACPKCGQYKYVSMRLYYMIATIVLFGCGVFLLILPPIGIGVILFSFVALFTGIFAKGLICMNCKYKSAYP